MTEVEMMDSVKTWKEFKEIYGFWDDEQVYTNCAMLIPVFRVEQWLNQINESLVRPLPCVRDKNGEIKEQPIKGLLRKINDEFDELKEAILGKNYAQLGLLMCAGGATKVPRILDEDARHIAEEAADTITAITTLCEALGIDAEMRDDAQRRVNERNRERGRL